MDAPDSIMQEIDRMSEQSFSGLSGNEDDEDGIFDTYLHEIVSYSEPLANDNTAAAALSSLFGSTLENRKEHLYHQESALQQLSISNSIGTEEHPEIKPVAGSVADSVSNYSNYSRFSSPSLDFADSKIVPFARYAKEMGDMEASASASNSSDSKAPKFTTSKWKELVMEMEASASSTPHLPISALVSTPAPSSSSSSSSMSSTPDTLASIIETDLIVQLRKVMGPTLTSGPHSTYEEVVGDISLLRFLRTAQLDVVAASILVQEHLAMREEMGMDIVRERITKEAEKHPTKTVTEGK
tara:strand:- start:112 stop:1005 length:894 start_codon:yes stop_codon:yes gene_type:complete